MPKSLQGKLGTILAVLAAVGWAWAVALLTTREHTTAAYAAMASAPPLWGFLALSNTCLATIGAAGILVMLLLQRLAGTSDLPLPLPVRWLLLAWVIPLLDSLRMAGWGIPCNFLEPVFVAGITGAGAWGIASGLESTAEGRPWSAKVPWLGIAWILAIAAGAWWYYEAQQAYDNFLLGYNDFGHFAWRVVNTWEGRGFLMETPSLPAFWDHFNPGLALLAPLWGLWPDARLFFVIQAVCLALPALLVYAIARRLGGTSAAAAAWAAAYLLYPALGQLNVNCSYGWHPVSLALPLMFAALAALLCGWRAAACAACVLACSFKEDVFIALACLSLVMAFQAWRDRGRDGDARPGIAALANRLPWWGWLAAFAVFLAAFAAVFVFSPFSRYQVGRFTRLGSSFGEVLLSPVLRPGVFWGTLLRPESAYFLLALMVPLGLKPLKRGWLVLAAAAPPLGVLLAWGNGPATSIAFQYTTTLIPILFLAAMAGAASPAGEPPGRVETTASPAFAARLWVAGVAAVAACAVASTWFGAMPWTRFTFRDVLHQTYGDEYRRGAIDDRMAGSQGCAAIHRILAKVGRRESSVLASGRIAAHLLGVRRLDTIAQAGDRWKSFQAEVGPGRSPIELFDWIVIDAAENFYQSQAQRAFILEEAQRAGYRLIEQDRGILVYGRPPISPHAE